MKTSIKFLPSPPPPQTLANVPNGGVFRFLDCRAGELFIATEERIDNGRQRQVVCLETGQIRAFSVTRGVENFPDARVDVVSKS